MNRRRSLTMVFGALLTCVSLAPVAAQEDATPAELRQAMRQFYENRLRETLQLSDDEMESLRPAIDELEALRRSFREQRSRATRELRDGLRDGARDAELQAQLDRLDALEGDHRQAERAVMARIDEQLSVRRRVQFRFFSERFRRELQRRVQSMRGGERQQRRDGQRPDRPPRDTP